MQKTSKAIKNKFVSLVLIVFFVFGLFSFNTFEGGSCAGVTWTYNSSTNTATASGTGTTNFAELVQADIDGGWGGVYTSDASGTQILCAGKIDVGDGSTATVFSDTNKDIIFVSGIASGYDEWLWRVRTNSTITLGVLADSASKTTQGGCTIRSLDTTYRSYMPLVSSGTLNLFGCTFSAVGSFVARHYIGGQNSNCKTYNCIFVNVQLNTITDGDFYNVYLSYGFSGILTPSGNPTFDTMYLKGFNADVNSVGLYLGYGYSLTFRNVVFANNSKMIRCQSLTVDNYLVNCVSDAWSFYWATAGQTGKVFRQYEFDLNVLNGEITDFVQNANVTLYKDNVKVYSGLTNSSGMIPTQTLTYGYYQQSTGNAIQNASSPYYLVITHPDWQTYVSRFYITQPLRLTVSMQEPTYTGYTEAEKSDYTTIILFVISLILCIIGLALTVPLLPLIALTVSVINVLLLTEISTFNILLIILNIIFTVITIVRTKTKNN